MLQNSTKKITREPKLEYWKCLNQTNSGKPPNILCLLSEKRQILTSGPLELEICLLKNGAESNTIFSFNHLVHKISENSKKYLSQFIKSFFTLLVLCDYQPKTQRYVVYHHLKQKQTLQVQYDGLNFVVRLYYLKWWSALLVQSLRVWCIAVAGQKLYIVLC